MTKNVIAVRKDTPLKDAVVAGHLKSLDMKVEGEKKGLMHVTAPS